MLEHSILADGSLDIVGAISQHIPNEDEKEQNGGWEDFLQVNVNRPGIGKKKSIISLLNIFKT